MKKKPGRARRPQPKPLRGGMQLISNRKIGGKMPAVSNQRPAPPAPGKGKPKPGKNDAKP